jgi:glucokinase
VHYYLGLDIGGSSIKSGVLSDSGEVLASRRHPLVLNGRLELGLETLFQVANEVVADAGVNWDDIRGIGVAAPGTMDTTAGVVLLPFNMPGWENLPLAKIVSDRFEKLVVLHNDANAAAYGEFWVGAARGASSLLMWTLGTGIGSGIVLNGQIWEGAHGHAGECGHIILQLEGGPPSEHQLDGSLELLAGSKALIRNVKAAIAQGRHSSLSDVTELTTLDIAQAAENGDELAHEVILDAARCLGVGTVSVMNVLNPEMVLIGGAMTFGCNESEVGRRFLQRIREEVTRRAFQIPAERTAVEFASLGADAGFIGAAGYVKLKMRGA